MRNRYADKKQRRGRGTVGRTTVAGAKDRQTDRVSAAVVEGMHTAGLERAAEQPSGDHAAYHGLPYQRWYGASEYVRDQAHKVCGFCEPEAPGEL